MWINRRRSLVAAVLVAGTSLSGTGFAQNVPAAQSASAGDTGEIIVTAQRRAESLQRVPVAIVAITGEQLVQSGIKTSQDIALVTPGVTLTTNRNGLTPFIRGVGTQNSTTEGSIAVYIDNVYMASTAGSLFSLNNIERVEVLKGPQGTLFGRNATGGVIRVITRDPSSTPDFKASLGYGNYDTVTGSVYATTGLAPNLAADLALFGSHQGDGWGTNFFTGRDVNYRREWAARSKVKLDLGDTTAVLAGDYSVWRTDFSSMRQVIPGTVGLGGTTFIGSIYDANSSILCSCLDAGFGTGAKNWQYGLSLDLKHNFSNDVSISSTTAYRRYKIRSYLDADYSPAVSGDIFFGEYAKSIQQEVLLNASTSNLDLTAGLFYYHSEAGVDPYQVRSSTASFNTATFSKVTTNSYAAFGQISYHITDTTRATVGLRYTRDKIRIQSDVFASIGSSLPLGTLIATGDTLPDDRTRNTWGRVTWRFGLDQELAPDVLLYGSVSRGYKAGAYNYTSPPTSATPSPTGNAVNPETIDAYEVGIKSSLLDRQLRLNVGGFIYDYKNIQLTAFTPSGLVSTLLNAASARIKGLEAEFNYAPKMDVGQLVLSGGATYLDAHYGSFPNAPSNVPRTVAPFGNVAARIDASGFRMIKTPKISTSVTIDYSTPITESLTGGVNVVYSHTGRFPWEIDNRLTQSATDIVNAQVRLGRTEGPWTVRVWTRNLLNEKYYTVSNSLNFGDAGAAAPPRTYGITLDLDF